MNGERPSMVNPAESGGDEAEKIKSAITAFLESSERPRSLIDDWEERRTDEEYCREFTESLSDSFGSYLLMISFAMQGTSKLKIGNEYFSTLSYQLFGDTKLSETSYIVQSIIPYLGQNPDKGTSVPDEQIITARDFFEDSTEFAGDLLELLKGQE